jgi:hypothetical protein
MNIPTSTMLKSIEASTIELAQAASEYRAGIQTIAANPGLSRQGREEARADLRSTLAEVVERLTGVTSPMLLLVETQSEDQLRDLSRSTKVNEAVSRISLALEQSHPGDLINILSEDGDVAGLLALRQVAPSIAGRFTKIPDERATFTETIRLGVDKALTTTSSTDPDTAAAVTQRFAIDNAREKYLAAVNFAVNPDVHGQLGVALSDAMVSA